MRRSIQSVLGVAVLGVVAIAGLRATAAPTTATTTAAPLGGDSSASDAGPLAAAPRAPAGSTFTILEETRGATKALTFHTNETNFFVTHLLAASQEIDVTTILVENGNYIGGSTASGAFVLQNPDGVFTILASHVPGTTQYTFDPPMSLREGARVEWQGTTGELASFAQLHLRGFSPTPMNAIAAR